METCKRGREVGVRGLVITIPSQPLAEARAYQTPLFALF